MTEPDPTHLNVPVNTTGLLGLPVEVFASIHDELLADSRIITQEDAMSGQQYLYGDYLKSKCPADILRPLSQTCRALRRMYLPVVYEHMDAWIIHGHRSWFLQLINRLERTCKHLALQPELAMLVQYVIFHRSTSNLLIECSP